MANISEGADYRISIWGKGGMKLCEVDATFHCLWAMAPIIGTAYFTLSTNDPKCTQENLQFGNYVLFEHQELGNWAGFITPHNQRRWSGDRQVTIPIMAIEGLFSRRRAGAGSPMEGSAGAVFKTLINTANAEGDIRIRFNGSIYNGGDNPGAYSRWWGRQVKKKRDSLELYLWRRMR